MKAVFYLHPITKPYKTITDINLGKYGIQHLKLYICRLDRINLNKL